MGRGRRSIVLRVDGPENAGACKIVWNGGYELHVSVPVALAEAPPGTARATTDMGQIHQAAVTTDTGAALVVLIAYGKKIAFPQLITYLRPGPVKGSGGGMKNRSRSQEPERSSLPDTGHGEGVAARLHPRCPGESVGQPPAAVSIRARASQEAGHTAGIA